MVYEDKLYPSEVRQSTDFVDSKVFLILDLMKTPCLMLLDRTTL